MTQKQAKRFNDSKLKGVPPVHIAVDPASTKPDADMTVPLDAEGNPYPEDAISDAGLKQAVELGGLTGSGKKAWLKELKWRRDNPKAHDNMVRRMAELNIANNKKKKR